MQTAQSYNNIKVDASKRQRSPFNWNHDCNTTASFGLMQPLECRLIVPNSKTVMSVDPIVMMTPMVAPTVGRCEYHTYSAFIGMSDLIPKSFSPFLAKKTYARSTGIGKQVRLPYIALKFLSTFVLTGCRFTCYKRSYKSFDGVDRQYVKATKAECQGLFTYLSNNSLIEQYNSFAGWPDYQGPAIAVGAFLGFGSLKVPMANDFQGNDAYPDFVPSDGSYYQTAVTLDSADFVFERTHNGVDWCFAVRLSSFGKQIRKILIGLGYQVNFKSNREMCVLPLFAYYKAYFDSFGLTLYQNWESTNASYILSKYENGSGAALQAYSVEFVHFINDLACTYFTDPQDYISAHQRTDVVSGYEDGFINNVVYVDSSPSVETQTSESEPSGVDVVSKGAFINKVKHTEVDAELLKRLYKFTNRNTIAGQRIEELLRLAGYGKFVDECKSYFIGRTVTELQIGRGVATSDGVNNVTGTNNVMGEYYGVGYGHDLELTKKKFEFENEEFGYWVTFGGVVPKSGYCQGVDLTLTDVDPESLYQQDFDGLGYEASPMMVVKGSQDWCDSADSPNFEKNFGLVPRYTRYKQVLNKCNGDFSLRGSRDGYLPYTFDKFIDSDDGIVRYTESNGTIHVMTDSFVQMLPIAGNAWRYNSRYPWLNSLQRVFTRYNSDFGQFAPAGIESEVPHRAADFLYLYNEDDNFLCFNSFDMTCYAPMLPISESYGTLDDGSHGNATVSKS